MNFYFVIALSMSLVFESRGFAENPNPSPSLKPATSTKKMRGKRTREKETEGTEALNRFESDTVIKSRYEYNGAPLEVDPD